MHSDEVCQQILHATGGWPYLLDMLFERCGPHDDPRPYVDDIRHGLTDSSTELAQQFLGSLGLQVNDSTRVLEFIHHEGKAPVDLITPELIGGEPMLTPLNCNVAVEYPRRMGCLEAYEDELSVESVIGQLLAGL